MITIDNGTGSHREFAEALRGAWGSQFTFGGLSVVRLGRLAVMWGAFPAGTESVEVPSFRVRYPILFSGDAGTGTAIAEERAGFVKVPDEVKEKRFVVMGFATLND